MSMESFSAQHVDAETLTSWLVRKISDVLGVDPEEIDIHDQLADYGMDSRQFVDLQFDLEDFLGRQLPAKLVFDNPSISALVVALTNLTSDAMASPSDKRALG